MERKVKNSYHVAALPGDGIGPEVLREGLKVLNAVAPLIGKKFEVEEIPCGGQYMLAHGGTSDWPDGSLERCRAADVCILGAVGWPNPKDGGKTNVCFPDGRMAGFSPVIGMRTNLDLYANVRPVKLYKGVLHRVHGKHKLVWDPENVDMVFVRENTEGLYSGHGGILRPGGVEKVATDVRIITREGAERVCRFAFELARRRQRGAPQDGVKRVTCIVKDNVLNGCKFFKKVFLEIGEAYPDIEKDTAIVDAFTQWLITKPEWYNVLVTTNMFGDIVTDLASVLQGGMGMAVGCNTGDKHAMFEPIHGSAPKYTGQDKVNPMATILAVKESLDWLGLRHQDEALKKGAAAIEKAVVQTLQDGTCLTYDLCSTGKPARCSEVGSRIAERAAQALR
ncbi:isocitrate/isopropylmalate dehydrogenase family protein [bacterium]|nr:isocitrate/isopropylmalate dehydrogenase family protein [bacterium]